MSPNHIVRRDSFKGTINVRVHAGNFLQHQELPHVSAVNGFRGSVNRRFGHLRRIQVSDQPHAGVVTFQLRNNV